MKSSLEIAQDATLQPIETIAERTGLLPEEFEPYGRYKAKVSLDVISRLSDAPDGKLVCVAGVTPTKAGEGKTTTAVSLTQGLGAIGRDPLLCLREPSLGPVFGVKGGAAGGGLAQVVPMEDLNLHFTGDIHAVGGGQQPARRGPRRVDPARQPARDRRAPGGVEARARHERPRAAPDHARAGRPGERLPARVGLRHHRRLRGHGDPRGVARPAGPAQAARRDHRRRGPTRAASRSPPRTSAPPAPWPCSSRMP